MDMPSPAPGDDRLRFGVFAFDPRGLELEKNGRPIALRPQAAKLLALLIAAGGEVVSRGDIQRALWAGDTFVDFDQGMNHAIRQLRAALGDSADSPRFIQTLPRRGYRFLAPLAVRAPVPAHAVAVPGDRIDPEPIAPPRRTRSRLAATGAVLIGVVSAAGIFVWRSPAEPVPLAPRVLAVRPFATVGADPSAGTGLAYAIAARLGGQQTLTVAAPRVATTADALAGVTHVLDGQLTQRGQDVTVLVRLEDVASDGTLWSDSIHVRADELFSVENVVSERVVRALRLRLEAGEHDRLRRQDTTNGAAYADYLRGRSALVRYTPADTRLAVESFERALSRDATFAAARAGLAMACADMYLRFAPGGEADGWAERAETEARAALEANPALGEAHLARAAVARKREFDWDATIEESRRALVLNPSLDQAHLFMAAASSTSATWTKP